jgi:hypothetical protein
LGPAWPGPGAGRARDLEDQIGKLQAELAAVRAKAPEEVRVTRADLGGVEPAEMQAILHTLAVRQLGPDFRSRLDLQVGSNELTVRGNAEAVRWAAGVIKKLAEKSPGPGTRP